MDLDNIDVVFCTGSSLFPLEEIAGIPGAIQKMLELYPIPRATEATVRVFGLNRRITSYEIFQYRKESDGNSIYLDSRSFSQEELD